MSFQYTPDEIAIHPEGTIKQLCKPFSSHENGLPEWIKNSSDAYVREDISPEQRIIVVFLESGKNNRTQSISCLDFVGMDSEAIENRFRRWGDPDAASDGKVDFSSRGGQGGHGNGGKAYMCSMFSEYSTLYTVRNGRGCIYGVSYGKYRFGYVPDPRMGRDFRVDSLVGELGKALDYIGAGLSDLPIPVQSVAHESRGFTLISGFGPIEFSGDGTSRQLVENLIEHPQCLQSLQICQVYVVIDGQCYDKGRSLSLPQIKPYRGLETHTCEIPRLLKDPVTGQNVSTVNLLSPVLGKLELFSSEKSMRWKSKYRHVVNYRAKSGFIGYVHVLELDIKSAYRDNIFGDCWLDELEKFKQNDRSRLAESTLTRAVNQFIAEQIQSFAEQFEIKERRKRTAKERSELTKANEALNRWKNRFLTKQLTATKPHRLDQEPPLPVGRPVRIELSLTHQKAGIGVPFKPSLRFFDKDGNRVRQEPYHWISDDTNVAMVLDDVNMVQTFSPGTTFIYAETHDGRLLSNKAPLEVVLIEHIVLDPLILELPAGSRKSIDAICHLKGGRQAADVCLVWTEDNSRVARVVAPGLVYGLSLGETNVVAGDDHTISDSSVLIKVVDPIRSDKNKDRGEGFPLILISEYDNDPETGETVIFKPDDAPILQRTEDWERNIWWINSAAPFARLFLDKSRGYGYDTMAWRIYFIERYTEIIAQIIMIASDAATRQHLSMNDWIFNWGNRIAEIQSHAALELEEYIANNILPS